MNRRKLTLLLGGAVTAPGAPHAQQKPLPVIGTSAAARPWGAD